MLPIQSYFYSQFTVSIEPMKVIHRSQTEPPPPREVRSHGFLQGSRGLAADGFGWVRMGSGWKRGSLTQQLKLGNLNLIMVIMARMTQLVHNSWMMIDNDMDKHVDKWLIWSVVWNMNGLFFPFSWEFHHPNWRTPSFFRGVGLNHQPVMKIWDLDLNLIYRLIYDLDYEHSGAKGFDS